MEIYEPEGRICDECGAEIWQGYCVDGGMEYYCDHNNNECLTKHYSMDEWEEMCDTNEDNYWTEWWDEYDSKYFDDESDKLLKHLYIADKLLEELSLSHTNTAMCYMNNGRIIEIADHYDEIENPAKDMQFSLCLLCSKKEWDKPCSKYRRNYSPVIDIVEFGMYDNVADIVERLIKINNGTPLDE